MFKKLSFAIKSYINANRYAINVAWRSMLRQKLAAFFTILIIAITLTLPITLKVVLSNVKNCLSNLQARSSAATLYIKDGITLSQIDDLVEDLKHDNRFTDVKFISSDEGLAEFSQIVSSKYGAQDLLQKLPNNPVPNVITLKLSNPTYDKEELNFLLNKFKKNPCVSSIQFDMTWLYRLYRIAQVLAAFSFFLSGLLGLGVILIVFNVINSAIREEKEEIEIWQQSGATNSFIRRPFIYIGAFYGLLGGVMTFIIALILKMAMHAPLNKLFVSFAIQSKPMMSINFSMIMIFFCFSTLLGIIGACVGVFKQISNTIDEDNL